MLWVQAFALPAVSHLVGDFVVHNRSQALHKAGGLGPDPLARRALLSHIVVYMSPRTGARVARLPGWRRRSGRHRRLDRAHDLVPHDRRLLGAYVSRVKMVGEPSELRLMGSDHSLHFVVPLGAALSAT